MSDAPNPNPTANNPAPDRFELEIGGEKKILTKDEAIKLIADSAALRTQLKEYEGKTAAQSQLMDHLRRMVNNNDFESFRVIAKEVGWSDAQINAKIAAYQAAKQPARAAADDDDEEPPVRQAAPQPDNSPITWDRLDPQLKKLFTEVVSGMRTHTVRSIENDVRTQLANDPVVGKIVKRGGDQAEWLVAKALTEAKRALDTKGGRAPDIFEDAIATARREAKGSGLLARAEAPSPNMGVSPGFAELGDVGPTLPDGVKMPSILSDDYATEIGTMLQTLMDPKE